MKKAIITADGMFREFVPLSLEKPKALWKVRGEILIERLIKQAKEVGISDITIVVGYKKEMFLFLENESGVTLVENPDFKKSEYSQVIQVDGETIVCSASDYYPGNPFAGEKADPVKFNTLDELRIFDTTYQLYSGSNIMRNIRLVFRCEEDEITNLRYLDRQQTNTSFIFAIKGVNYIYRHPAPGNEEYVNWKNETRSMIIAKELGIDTSYIYADFREGWKIMEFIGPHGKPSYDSFEDSKKIIKVLRKLHSADVVVDYGMEPWKDAEGIIEKLNEINPAIFAPYEKLREKIYKLYEKTLTDGVKKCFCHGDTYRPNWMMMPDDSVILIDWEFAGYSDPGVDVGYYISDACYEPDEAERFIREYLQDDFTQEKLQHFLIYTALISYYWYMWALHRRAIGEPREDIEFNYGIMAEKYSEYLLSQNQ